MAKKKTSAKKRSAGPAEDLSGLTYESAIEEIESINDRIESGEIGLEASLAAYERGMRLIAHCRSILDKAEQRIEALTPTDADGPG
jgi:exodeoxyribonuclease VII small subunit